MSFFQEVSSTCRAHTVCPHPPPCLPLQIIPEAGLTTVLPISLTQSVTLHPLCLSRSSSAWPHHERTCTCLDPTPCDRKHPASRAFLAWYRVRGAELYHGDCAWHTLTFSSSRELAALGKRFIAFEPLHLLLFCFNRMNRLVGYPAPPCPQLLDRAGQMGRWVRK